MRQLLTLLALATGCIGLASAASFSGTLLDATCYNQQKKADACTASGATTSFMIQVSDKIYQLDEAGNAKAAAAMKNRADRSVPNPTEPNSTPDPKSAPTTQVTAKVTGKLEGETITVETIDVQ
jgi:hypothetical protein